VLQDWCNLSRDSCSAARHTPGKAVHGAARPDGIRGTTAQSQPDGTPGVHSTAYRGPATAGTTKLSTKPHPSYPSIFRCALPETLQLCEGPCDGTAKQSVAAPPAVIPTRTARPAGVRLYRNVAGRRTFTASAGERQHDLKGKDLLSTTARRDE